MEIREITGATAAQAGLYGKKIRLVRFVFDGVFMETEAGQ